MGRLSNIMQDSLRTIMITFREEMMPADMMDDLEKYLKEPGCVIYLQAYLGDKYLITISGSDAVEKLLSKSKVRIKHKRYAYELYEDKVKRICVEKISKYLSVSDVDSALQQFGKIITSDIYEERNKVCYFALIDLQKRVPEKIMIKRHQCELKYF